METKILIIANKTTNLLDAILFYMENEKIDYFISPDFHNIEESFTNIIWIDDTKKDRINIKADIPIIRISNNKKQITDKLVINTILTNLISDNTIYTNVQKEYLYRKGIYSILLQKLNELIDNPYNYNGIIYDLTQIKTKPNNWIFKFDSIGETYTWLSKMNKSLPNDFVRKGINFYDDKVVYNDSLKEINYLTEKIVEIKEQKKNIDIFICTKEEFNKLKDNYFFKLLLKNICNTFILYLIDKNTLIEKEPIIYEKILDGIAIYKDCIYRDTYQDEMSLGYVDCNQNTIDEYNKYFDYLVNNYGYKINTESDFDEFQK